MRSSKQHRIDLAMDDLRYCPFLCRVYRSDWRAVQGIGHNLLDYLSFLTCYRRFSQTLKAREGKRESERESQREREREKEREERERARERKNEKERERERERKERERKERERERREREGGGEREKREREGERSLPPHTQRACRDGNQMRS